MESQARVSRMSVGRFWGLGPHSHLAQMTSYSRAHASASVRAAHPVPPWVGTLGRGDLGLRALVSYDAVFGSAIEGVPSTRTVHPRVPNCAGNTWLSGLALELRQDSTTRVGHHKRGLWMELSLAAMVGVSHSPHFVVAHVDVRQVWLQTSKMGTAARFWGRWVSTAKAPFFAQSTLGGGHYLRGHSDGRFVDQNAWTVEVEQRVQLWQWRLGGASLAWHLDPFVVVGQVFGPPQEALSAPRGSVGLGLRSVLRPHNVVTRWDVASDFDRVRGNFAVGYPF